MNALDTRDSRYQTLARIGSGGMAEVLLAAMQANGVTKLAVLKCLRPELAEDPDFIEMFLDEARLCARLAHPNVVQTYEVLQHGDRLAMAMEYLEGQPLTSVLHRLSDKLAFGERLGIVAHVLAGLEHAHNLTDLDGTALGVVHRDVSPHNVIVTYDGHVKLIDFGVAKTLASSHQTRPGGVKGKMAYLAPEAMRGDLADRRSDIFSVGVMLWELLANRRLWGQIDDGVIAWRLATGEPAPELPRELDIPVGLRAVCRRALALDPDRRQQSAAELASDLERFGPLTREAHARHLGYLVSRAFQAERIERRALVEFHLRGATVERGGPNDYETLELSSPDDDAPELDVSDVTTIHQRRLEERRLETLEVELSEDVSGDRVDDLEVEIEILAERGHAFTTGDFVATPRPLMMTPPPIVRHGWSRTALVATAAAAVMALVSASRLGSDHGPRDAAARQLAGSLPSAAPPAAPPAPLTVESKAMSTTPEPHAERQNRRRPRRPQIDLLSDDVLDLDGRPLQPSRGSGVSRD
ncbi:MAG: serine/threonine protein kinase [Myxococcales bacterium]|nr:serine/threonine protein kinase [Myxococcales bacterium]